MNKPDPILIGLLREIQGLRKEVERLKGKEYPLSTTFSGVSHVHPPGDATTLDGIDSTGFAPVVHAHDGAAITTGTVVEARIDSLITRDSEVIGIVLANDGVGSGVDSDLLDGVQGAGYALVAHTHANIGARVYHNANQSIADATWTPIACNAELWDTSNFHDLVTNNSRITIPAGGAGKYLVVANVAFASNATGYRAIQIYANGATTLATTNTNAVNGTETWVCVTTILNLSAGDYIEVMAFQNSTGALNVVSANFYSPHFMVTFLGA